MIRIELKETRLGLRNSQTRIPFRYGVACLTRCPQAVLQATIESAGRRATGYSGDCLPPSWFDKNPQRDFAGQIDDMLAVIGLAEKTFAEEFASPQSVFDGWLPAYECVQSRSAEWGLTPLLASFGVSMVERALMDAVSRLAGLSWCEALRQDVFGIRPGDVHPSLRGRQVGAWLPPRPTSEIFVRHTVGLGDPLTAGDVEPADKLDDGFPQTLEEYVQRTGVRYFKIKVANRPQEDLARLGRIAKIVQDVRGSDYQVTLDGNEQYGSAEEFAELIDAIEHLPALQTLWRNTLLVEQPLQRSIALSPRHTGGLRELGVQKPIIIDESDGTLEAFAEAVELGYRGVSSKSCKGPIKSVLNAGLVWFWNGEGARDDFLITGEDLCTVGVIPVQTDLSLVAALGLKHVERNGHHFHPGLSYLPQVEQDAALEAHPDLYTRRHGRIAPRLNDGRFRIDSLQCAGFGFAVLPDMEKMQRADEWDFASLGL